MAQMQAMKESGASKPGLEKGKGSAETTKGIRALLQLAKLQHPDIFAEVAAESLGSPHQSPTETTVPTPTVNQEEGRTVEIPLVDRAPEAGIIPKASNIVPDTFTDVVPKMEPPTVLAKPIINTPAAEPTPASIPKKNKKLFGLF